MELVRHGVTFCEDRGIRNITYRQENMGRAMADGFARVSGRVPGRPTGAE